MKLGSDILLNFKIVVAKTLIDRWSNCKRLFPISRPSEQKSHEPSMPREVLNHMFEFPGEANEVPLLYVACTYP